jgi:ATP-dependent helicase YprA (DUF1998 family)
MRSGILSEGGLDSPVATDILVQTAEVADGRRDGPVLTLDASYELTLEAHVQCEDYDRPEEAGNELRDAIHDFLQFPVMREYYQRDSRPLCWNGTS